MSLLTQLRQDSASFIADASSPLPLDASLAAAAGPVTSAAAPTTTPAWVVSPPTEWTLPDADWLPPLMRGLPVYLPADDWWIPADGLEASSLVAGAPQAAGVRKAAPGGAMLCDCGCPLFWEPVGQVGSTNCVECTPPPIRRIVEDLWLADGDGWFECVSKEPKWIRAAFAHLKADEDRRAAEQAERAKRDNEGF